MELFLSFVLFCCSFMPTVMFVQTFQDIRLSGHNGAFLVTIATRLGTSKRYTKYYVYVTLYDTYVYC